MRALLSLLEAPDALIGSSWPSAHEGLGPLPPNGLFISIRVECLARQPLTFKDGLGRQRSAIGDEP